MTMRKTLLLFDVDGTLTPARKVIRPEMIDALHRARAAGFTLGVVGGSDIVKQQEQLGATLLDDFDYIFSENGLLAFRHGSEFHRNSLLAYLGNDRVVAFVKKCLRAIADLDIPVQRGTFVEFRNGMFNISPIGRNCSQAERDAFEQYDKQHNVRAKLIADLERTFPDYPLKYSVGGQISFDVFPIGWDKTYCLQFVEKEFDEVHFFGDKTSPGGNDYEIYTDKRVTGHSVTSYTDTIALVDEMTRQRQRERDTAAAKSDTSSA